MRCQYAQEDGAYVLGALSPAERAEYERHLGTCPTCRRAVADLAVLPGLLSRLPGPEEAVTYVAAATPVPLAADSAGSRLPRLLEAAAAARRRDRRARSWRAAMAALAAACLALVVGVGIGVVREGEPPPTTPAAPAVELVAMLPVSTSVPVTAEVGLAATGGGTEVTMRCTYAAGSAGYTKPWTLRLIAYGPDGAKEQVGSWTAAPGDDVRLSGITRFAPDELVRLELVKGNGDALLTYHVP
jgi:hypothetical protein